MYIVTRLRPTCFLHCLPRAPHFLGPRRIVTTLTSNTAPIDIPKLIVSPGSKHHNSLPTFLEYAQRKGLRESSPVYVGTHFEYVAALSLLRLGFSLLRTGRRADAGIDLLGHWVLPPLREPLPVIVQCKATYQGASPAHIRELEGSFQNLPAEWHRKDVLGLFVSATAATSGVLHAISTSRKALGFVKITRTGTIEQLFWNRAASDRGLEGVSVTMRHTPRILLPDPSEWDDVDSMSQTYKARSRRHKIAKQFKASGTKMDVQMTWLGEPIVTNREAFDPATAKLVHDIEAKFNQEIKGPGRPRTHDEKLVRPHWEPPQPSLSINGKRLGRPPKTPDSKQTASPSLEGVKRRRGRPPGAKSKNPKKKAVTLKIPKETKRGRGRPLGAKNKSKKPAITFQTFFLKGGEKVDHPE